QLFDSARHPPFCPPISVEWPGERKFWGFQPFLRYEAEDACHLALRQEEHTPTSHQYPRPLASPSGRGTFAPLLAPRPPHRQPPMEINYLQLRRSFQPARGWLPT